MSASANMLTVLLPVAAIFSSGGMLGEGVTAESERRMKGLTLLQP